MDRTRRVGILLQSTNCDRWLYETVRELAAADNVELWFVVADARPPRRRRTLAAACFRALMTAERALLRVCGRRVLADGAPGGGVRPFSDRILSVSPEFSPSGLVVRYSAKDIERMRAIGFDLLVRGNAEGIFRGEILRVANDGIVSWHHGDNRWNRGGPPGFWETYQRRASSGFVIQALTEELDGGRVVFRGSAPTQRFATANATSLRDHSNAFLAKVVLDYADAGRLPQPEEPIPYAGPLYRIPTCVQSARYALQVLAFLPAAAWARVRRLARPSQHGPWAVAVTERPWRAAVLRRSVRIETPPGTFLADPVVVSAGGRTVVFVEEYVHASKRAHISAIELLGGAEYRMLGPAVVEPFHLAFPSVFKVRGRLYMTPQTAGAAPWLYECTEFPLGWKRRGRLHQGPPMTDPLVFEHGALWWLLGGRAGVEGAETTHLLAFWSEDPLSGEWTPHERTPLLVDSQTARNGGLLFEADGTPVRVRQALGFGPDYGARLTLARITKLTPSAFEERQIAEIGPDFFPGIRGCHHMSGTNRWTAFDYR